MKRKKPFRLGFLIFFSILLFACSNQEGLQKIQVAEVTHSIFYAPLYIAIEKGFFEEEGLEVELTTVPGGDKTMTALISGGADIALIGAETSIYVNAQGAEDPIINFAQLTQTDGTFLVARGQVTDFSWEMLNNSTFLGQRKGGMPQMVGEYVLKKHHIDPHNDLNLIQNIEFANVAPSFASGTGDFVQLFEPTASVFEKEGIGTIVASFGTESGIVPYTVFMTKKSTIENDPEMVEKFTRAIYQAQVWVYEQPAEEAARAIQPFFDDVELDIIATSLQRYKDQYSFAPNPIIDEEEWNHLQDIMEEAGELPERSEYQEFVNTEIASKVVEE